MALLLVLISMATATTTLGWLASQDNAAPLSRNISRAAQSRAIASSGLELAVAIMQTNSDWRTMHSGGKLLEDHEMDSGRIDVRLTDVATNLPPVAGSDTIHIKVTARVEDFTQHIEAIASVVNNGSADSEDVSGFAVWVGEGLELKGHSSIRRWDDAPDVDPGQETVHRDRFGDAQEHRHLGQLDIGGCHDRASGECFSRPCSKRWDSGTQDAFDLQSLRTRVIPCPAASLHGRSGIQRQLQPFRSGLVLAPGRRLAWIRQHDPSSQRSEPVDGVA